MSVEGAFDAKLKFLHHLVAITFLDRIVLLLSNDSLDILGESDVEEDGAAQASFKMYQVTICFHSSPSRYVLTRANRAFFDFQWIQLFDLVADKVLIAERQWTKQVNQWQRTTVPPPASQTTKASPACIEFTISV